jgi:hypothetical protein
VLAFWAFHFYALHLKDQEDSIEKRKPQRVKNTTYTTMCQLWDTLHVVVGYQSGFYRYPLAKTKYHPGCDILRIQRNSKGADTKAIPQKEGQNN